MKLYTMAIGVGIGYLVGNERARHKAADAVRRLKSSPQAKAVESKVSDKVSTLTEGLTDKATSMTNASGPEKGQSSVVAH